MNWEKMHESDFEPAIENLGGLCVIPIGCTEKHGQHLPVGTDSLKAQKICEKAAEIEDVVIFPCTMWLGDVCAYHSLSREETATLHRRGGIGISPEILFSAYREICEEIYRNGFRKILFVNSHGGNTAFLDYFTRTMYYERRDYAVMWTGASGPSIRTDNLYEYAKENKEKYPELTNKDFEVLARFAETGTGGGHADFRETGLIYATAPETVKPEAFEAESGASTHRADYLQDAGIKFGPAWGANYPNMLNGFASTGCSEAIGKLMMDLCAEGLAQKFKLLKADEECVRIARHLPSEK